jgi:DNA replication ATP-dependent helicase Dna2
MLFMQNFLSVQGSGKTHFLALFTAWYLTTVRPQPSGKARNFVIGVTAFTRAAIDNLLTRIHTIQKTHDKSGEFEIASMGKDSNKEGDIKEYLADSLAKKLKKGQLAPGGQPVVIGGTVWDWYKVRKELKTSWEGIDMLIIDEGSQVDIYVTCILSFTSRPPDGDLTSLLILFSVTRLRCEYRS